MANIPIPLRLRDKLGRPEKMDFHCVDLRLRDGRIVRGVAVLADSYISGYSSDPELTSDFDFQSEDIVDIRPHNPLYLFWWSSRKKIREGKGGK